MAFRLRYLRHNFELAVGQFLIGRSPECQFALDDPLVSRKHAALIVTRDKVVIKDLGSRNGVAVNGSRIDGSQVLADGDRIIVGAQELTVITGPGPQPPLAASPTTRTGAQTLTVLPAVHAGSNPEAEREPTKRIESLPMLSALADKALALGRPEDAERILSAVLEAVVRALREGRSLTPDSVDQAGQYAVRLAGATGKGSWVDYVITLYTQVRRPCPAAIVDELHAVIRKIAPIDIAALRAYLETLHEDSTAYGPAERFLVQRIEGLERLAALR